MRVVLLILLFTTFAFGERMIRVATYNVENLFDLNDAKYRYDEFKQGGKRNWNLKNYTIKLKNIAKVIKEIDADIISLQEIGSLKALKDLRYRLKEIGAYYPYFKIANKKNTSIKVAILSREPFIYNRELSVGRSYRERNILESKFKIDGRELYIFTNHWKSKSGPESRRVSSAKVLRDEIERIGYDKNIIILGDFNSDYEEYKKFIRARKLNDTNGKTGINHILRTIKQTKEVSMLEYEHKNFYNLWYDTQDSQRYSYIYRGKKEAIDNILISQSLIKQSDIYYKISSIKSYKPKYLFKGKRVYRWQIRGKNPRRHSGKGYSDHLGVVCEFIVE